MLKQTLTIATRGSKLALWQAEYVRKRIVERRPDLTVDILVLKTRGDIILDVPLAKVGGKGLFVKEIEEALLDGRADMAVHSMKDVPMQLPDGLVIGIIPQRAAPYDLFVSNRHPDLESLPRGATVGTSSLRRQAQLLALRPDIIVHSLRGNVDTRIRKLNEGQFAAIIMAAAGLLRLGIHTPHMAALAPPDFLPAAGQGALGIEFANSRTDIHDLLQFMEDTPTRTCVEAERGFLAGLDGGCQVPIAAHARMTDENSFILDGLVASPDGKQVIREHICGETNLARETGLELAQRCKNKGADMLLRLRL